MILFAGVVSGLAGALNQFFRDNGHHIVRPFSDWLYISAFSIVLFTAGLFMIFFILFLIFKIK